MGSLAPVPSAFRIGIVLAAMSVTAGCGATDSANQGPIPTNRGSASATPAVQAERTAVAYLRAVAAGDERTACRMVAGPTIDAPGCEGISATAQSIARRATQAGVTFDAVVVSGAVSLAGNGASVG